MISYLPESHKSDMSSGYLRLLMPIGNLRSGRVADRSLCDLELPIRVVMRVLMRSNSEFVSQVPSIDERAVLNTSA